MRKNNQREQRRSALWIVIIAIILIGTVGAVGYITDGFRNWGSRDFVLTENDKVVQRYTPPGTEVSREIDSYILRLEAGYFDSLPREDITVKFNGRDVTLYFVEFVGFYFWMDNPIAKQPVETWIDTLYSGTLQKTTLYLSNVNIFTDVESEIYNYSTIYSLKTGTIEIPNKYFRR